MGAVTNATFTKQFAIFLPRLWTHELYFQDDWKATPTLALNLGVRWAYSSPFKTKYGQQSQLIRRRSTRSPGGWSDHTPGGVMASAI